MKERSTWRTASICRCNNSHLLYMNKMRKKRSLLRVKKEILNTKKNSKRDVSRRSMAI